MKNLALRLRETAFRRRFPPPCFHLIDGWRQQNEGRQVFKFKLVAVEDEEGMTFPARLDVTRRLLIPTHVKLEVKIIPFC